MEFLNGILFIDIETASGVPDYNALPEGLKTEWDKKSRLVKPTRDDLKDPADLFTDRAGIFSEFARIVCISFGVIVGDDENRRLRLRSLAGEDERKILEDLCIVIEKMTARHKEIRFCGHNIKEFDIPFICRRMVINNISLPPCLQLSGRKPWEITHLDTLELWKFGDNKNYTSLSLLAQVLGIPSPKDDIDGSQVGRVFWQEKDIARISRYCMQDVFTTAKVFLRLKGIDPTNLRPDYAEGFTLDSL